MSKLYYGPAIRPIPVSPYGFRFETPRHPLRAKPPPRERVLPPSHGEDCPFGRQAAQSALTPPRRVLARATRATTGPRVVVTEQKLVM